MTALIKRLEEATEGSRELDGKIYAAVTGPMSWEIPHYTTSLDAAKTLLPEGAFYRVGNDGEGQNPGDFRADVVTERGSFHAVAQTDALALSSAALKAKDQS